MSLKPVSPTHRPGRPTRLATAPVVIGNKKSSGSGTWVVILLLLALLGGGYYFYSSSEAEKAAIRQKREAAAAQKAEQERRVAEQKRQHEEKRAKRGISDSALGSTAPEGYESTSSGSSSSCSSTTASTASTSSAYEEETAEETGTRSALGGTAAPTSGTGEFAVKDSSPAPFDLKAEGAAQKKVISKLEAAMQDASEGDTFHDLQADLQRSFEMAHPELFSDASTLPPFPAKEEKMLRLAQGVCVCLNLAAELQLDKEIAAEKHARFVNWLMKDKGKAARTFTYGLEHHSISDTAAATKLLGKLRDTYLKSPSSAMDKIPGILKPGKAK